MGNGFTIYGSSSYGKHTFPSHQLGHRAESKGESFCKPLLLCSPESSASPVPQTPNPDHLSSHLPAINTRQASDAELLLDATSHRPRAWVLQICTFTWLVWKRFSVGAEDFPKLQSEFDCNSASVAKGIAIDHMFFDLVAQHAFADFEQFRGLIAITARG